MLNIIIIIILSCYGFIALSNPNHRKLFYSSGGGFPCLINSVVIWRRSYVTMLCFNKFSEQLQENNNSDKTDTARNFYLLRFQYDKVPFTMYSSHWLIVVCELQTCNMLLILFLSDRWTYTYEKLTACRRCSNHKCELCVDLPVWPPCMPPVSQALKLIFNNFLTNRLLSGWKLWRWFGPSLHIPVVKQNITVTVLWL